MKSQHLFKLLLIVAVAASSMIFIGCGSKDTDPHQKIDAPGYYNGPMDPRGAGAKPGDEGAKK